MVGVDLRNRGNAPPYHHARPAVRLFGNGATSPWVPGALSARDVLPPPNKCLASWADRTTATCVDELDFSNAPTAFAFPCNTIGEDGATPRITRMQFTIPPTYVTAKGTCNLQFAWFDTQGQAGALDMAMAPDAGTNWYTLGTVNVTD